MVADEVRGLANRSAEAAQNTAVIIAGSLDRISEGGRLVAEAEESFASLVQFTDHMSAIIGDIAKASQSQAQDVQSMHQSIAMMDKVTQENAAGAGETQSLSKSLTRQAALLSKALREMNVILQGGPENRERRRSLAPSLGPRPGYAHDEPPPASSGAFHPLKTGRDTSREQALNQALPMDDDL